MLRFIEYISKKKKEEKWERKISSYKIFIDINISFI